MEAYYYQKMNKPQQAAYHAMQQGVLALADEIQLPRIPAEELTYFSDCGWIIRRSSGW